MKELQIVEDVLAYHGATTYNGFVICGTIASRPQQGHNKVSFLVQFTSRTCISLDVLDETDETRFPPGLTIAIAEPIAGTDRVWSVPGRNVSFYGKYVDHLAPSLDSASLRALGNKFFAVQGFVMAVQLYSFAIAVAEDQLSKHMALANKAAALIMLNMYEEVIVECDAVLKVTLHRQVVHRKFQALVLLEQDEDAQEALEAVCVAQSSALEETLEVVTLVVSEDHTEQMIELLLEADFLRKLKGSTESSLGTTTTGSDCSEVTDVKGTTIAIIKFTDMIFLISDMLLSARQIVGFEGSRVPVGYITKLYDHSSQDLVRAYSADRPAFELYEKELSRELEEFVGNVGIRDVNTLAKALDHVGQQALNEKLVQGTCIALAMTPFTGLCYTGQGVSESSIFGQYYRYYVHGIRKLDDGPCVNEIRWLCTGSGENIFNAVFAEEADKLMKVDLLTVLEAACTAMVTCANSKPNAVGGGITVCAFKHNYTAQFHYDEYLPALVKLQDHVKTLPLLEVKDSAGVVQRPPVSLFSIRKV